ncbi:T9SS type A sorting domain-containing protein [Winogradskyella pulchriflava]|uniref:T9SS type A sorting domain-containing protein n=1 Tax=Winogradskyella pulchriflava TaxID=1110688 RepID=A0ABV6Q7J8_9FLAO
MRAFIKFQYLLLFAFSFSFAQSDIQIVRIDFQNPEGYTRQLALGFVQDNSATDGVDYGYDSPNIEDLEDDLNWMIEDNRYVIQGVGAFDATKYYPLGMFLSNAGEVSISLNALESFSSPVDVYLYDLELNSYTLLNTSNLTQNLSAGTYLNRYFVTFSNSTHLAISAHYLLSTNEAEKSEIKLWHSRANNELHLVGLLPDETARLSLYSSEGKKIKEGLFMTSDYTMSTLGISNGIYFAIIETSTFVQTIKVCIAK